MREMRALVDLVRQLRAPGGCDWDRAQTTSSMRPYLLEETHEVLDAIDSGRPEALRAELGDLLFQVLLLSQIAEDEGLFTLEDVSRGIREKMERRHPHIFGEEPRDPGGMSIERWESIKARERSERESALDGIPKGLPALLRTHRVGEKAGRVGFDWPDWQGAREKVGEELAELDEALAQGDPAAVEAEHGDLLQALSHLSRHLGFSAEDSLRASNARFEERFRSVERLLRASGRSIHEAELEELEALWQRVKGEASL